MVDSMSRITLSISVAALVMLGTVVACRAPSSAEAACQAAMRLASANTNATDAVSALGRSDPTAYGRALTLASADLEMAVDLIASLPAGSRRGLETALSATDDVMAELALSDSSDANSLRLAVEAAQKVRESKSGEPAQCTDPIRPASTG